MTDIELLKSAASAISLDYIECGRLDGTGDLIARETGKIWNPLTDDGDALRLAVKLGLMLDDVTKGYMSGHIVAVSDGGTCYEPREPDPYAATRRAIVRAAAEIGKQ